MITPEQLQEWKRLADAAPPGPYFYDLSNMDIFTQNRNVHIGNISRSDAAGKLFATARTAMPALIAEVERLQAENGRLREALRVVKGHIPNSDMFHQAFIMQPENKLYDQYRAEIMHLIAVDFPEALKEVEL